jgi:hypothetical protein
VSIGGDFFWINMGFFWGRGGDGFVGVLLSFLRGVVGKMLFFGW